MSTDNAFTKSWRNAVMVMFAAGGVAISTWGPRLPSLQGSLHLGNGVIGVLLAGVTVGSIAGLAASSALLSILGPRGAITLALLLVALGIAVVGVGAGISQSLAATSIGFVILGFGIGALDVMINVQGAAAEKAFGKSLMPLLHAAWSVGAIIGSGLGAAAASLSIAFQWQFLIEAVVIAVVAVISVRFIPSTLSTENDAARPPVLTRVRAWLRGWGDWRLLMIGLVMLGVEFGEGTSNSWLTLAVHDGHHQSDVVAALFFTVFAIGETTARIFGGPLVDRIGRVGTVRITAAIGIVGLLLFILATPAWLVLVGTVFWAVGVSMGFPLGMSAAGSGPNPAARVSVVASIGYLANLGGPPIIGFLSESIGLLNAMWLVAALLLVAALAAGSLRIARRNGQKEPLTPHPAH